jgi:branched-chain amino acid transport system permease protein
MHAKAEMVPPRDAGEKGVRSARNARALRILAVLALLAGAAAFPQLAGSEYPVVIGTEILIVGLLAASLNLLLGYTGLVSLGHAAFFGIGAYSCALVARDVYPSIWLALISGGAASALVALVVGAVCVRLDGLYFAMITLGFSQMFYTVAYYWRSLTGGDDGMINIPRPDIAIVSHSLFSITSTADFYYFTLVVVTALLLLMRWIIGTPFGMMLQAIRENPERVQFIGIRVPAFKLAVFVLAAAFAGLAGGLFAVFQGFISPELLYWSKSGEIILMTIFGGVGSFFGPTVGAGVLILLRDTVLNYTDYWKFCVGIILIASVLLMPTGIAGFAKLLVDRLFSRRTL